MPPITYGITGAPPPPEAILLQNLKLESELVRTQSLLSPIPVLFFKGPLLTRRLHGDLRKRVSADNDIVVRKRDARAALAKLLAAGFQALPYLEAYRYLGRHGKVGLFHGGDTRAASIDLHTEPFDRALFRADEDLVWERTEEVEIHGQTVRTFDAVLSFLHLVSHFVQHRFELQVLRDVGIAWDRWADELEPDDVRAVAERTTGVEPVEFALEAAHRLGLSQRQPLPITRVRCRQVLSWFPPERLREDPHLGYLRAFLATYLAQPKRLPAQALRGVLLPPDELAAAANQPPSFRLYLQRASGPLEELRRRWTHNKGG